MKGIILAGGAGTMNLNVRYGKLSLALIAQAVTYQFRKKLPAPYKTWTAKHLSNSLFRGIDEDIRVKDDTVIVTIYNAQKSLNLQNTMKIYLKTYLRKV